MSVKRNVCAAAALAASLAGGRLVRADSVDSMNKKLVGFDAEVKQLSSGIRRPNELGAGAGAQSDVPTRRTIDAQVNFGVGNYDDAAIVLYDVVERYPTHPIHDEALYYLGESLYLKGDFVASRTYFTQLVKDRGTASKYYQQGLERLVELTLKLGDGENIDEWLSLLDAVPEAQRRSSVPYVRGKYAFYNDKHDEAIAQFNTVARTSPYWFQARYFIGAAHIAKKDLDKATIEYENLVREPTRSKDEKRVVELSHIALGRIHYERDQPSKAIDRYLEVSRRSDLFDEAMYEASWVYVRNKEFEKALRALELLGLSEMPTSRMPEVKILEGNLRIRKAQRLGDSSLKKDSEAEYSRAVTTFQGVRGQFLRPKEELERVVAEKRDPNLYLSQVTGRHAEVFDIKATLPEMAAAFLREEPEVKRIIAVEGDLGTIEDDIVVAEQTIERLEAALGPEARVNLFPELAGKRTRGIEIKDAVAAIRIDIATQGRKLLEGSVGAGERAELARLADERDGIARELTALPDGGAKESERISKARGRAIATDRQVAEAAAALAGAESQLVALEKFISDEGVKGSETDLAQLRTDIQETRADIQDIKAGLDEARRDAMIAQDRAGTGDETSVTRDQLRGRLRAALDEEHRYQQTLIGRLSGGDREKADGLYAAARRADGISVQVDSAQKRIDGIIEGSLAEVTTILSDEKAKLSAYRQEYATYDGESHGLGAEVLGGAFVVVSKKLYNVLLRSDVGVVDVAWSMKEGTDRMLRRLTLDQARETRTLDTEFSDVITEIRDQKERERQEAEKAVSQPESEAPAEGGGTP
jgi:TolA-binding protein